MSNELFKMQGVPVCQDSADAGNCLYWTADLSDDVDGSREAYRLDNNKRLALDDIHASAGYPHGDWHDILYSEPGSGKPFVDEDGFCISLTSYERAEFAANDRRRYLDAVRIPYSVAPAKARRLCRGILLGCKGQITKIVDGKKVARVETVCGDISGGNIGEASDFACKQLTPWVTARNADERGIYLYEFWPGTPAVLNGETFKLIRR